MTNSRKFAEGHTGRNGVDHSKSTVHAYGKSRQVRKTTKVPIGTKADRDDAIRERDRILGEVRHELIRGVNTSASFASIAGLYIEENTSDEGSLGETQILSINQFQKWAGEVPVRDVDAPMLTQFMAQTMQANKPTTRKRKLGPILRVLRFAKERHYITEVPTIKFSNKARTSPTIPYRGIQDMSSDLIAKMIDHAPIHARAQLAVEWSTGARVSSVLHSCALRDLDLSVPGSETITFHQTKNGDTVTAYLHRFAVDQLKDYLNWRGDLQQRDEPLFLTDQHRRYKRRRGDQNRKAIASMKRKAIKTLRREAAAEAATLRASGQPDQARCVWAKAQYEASLVASFSQHDLRRWFATNALQHMSIDEVRRQGGWRSLAALRRYLLGAPKYRQGMVQQLAIGPSPNSRPTTSTVKQPAPPLNTPSESKSGTRVAQAPRRRPKSRAKVWI